MSQKAGLCRVEYACLTDVGVRRSHNQDSYLELVANTDEQWLKQGHVFLVADGMGAHAVGELASKKAAEIIPHAFAKHAELGPVQALYQAFQEANQAIYQLGSQNPGFSGMGTTATALVLHASGAWVGHVGDTRVYRIRGGKIEQLTYDHSLRWEVARRRGQDPSQVTDVASNAIVRSLGPEETVQVDIEGPHPIQAGDVYVLCSDGLSGLVSDAEIGAIASSLGVKEAAKFLVTLANLRGGPDNITVIVVRVLSYEAPQSVAKPGWGERLIRAWNRLPLSARLALGSIPLALVCLGALFWTLLTPTANPQLGQFIAVGTFLAAATLLGLSWFVSRKEETLSQESEQTPSVEALARPGQVYAQSFCAPDIVLLDRLAQVQRHLEELVQEAGWPYRKEDFQRWHAESQRLLKQGKLAEAFRSKLQAVSVLAETAREHQRRQEVFLPNWNTD